MADESATLDVSIVRNDGSESFDLKAEQMTRSFDNNVVVRSVLAVAGDVIGQDLDLSMETLEAQGVIQEPDSDTYPSAESTPGYNAATEKEVNLASAFRRWGPSVDDGFDRMLWGPREETGILTRLSTTEDATGQRGVGKYTFTLEFTYANIVV